MVKADGTICKSIECLTMNTSIWYGADGLQADATNGIPPRHADAWELVEDAMLYGFNLDASGFHGAGGGGDRTGRRSINVHAEGTPPPHHHRRPARVGSKGEGVNPKFANNGKTVSDAQCSHMGSDPRHHRDTQVTAIPTTQQPL